ncbi:hypothetical protein M8C21_006346 [Ambrosia artemisiifolia]|uniref:Protein SLOW GREEN 1, chloroplastic n=1 Tax=Ambrosia artemisiifolia TaxID=4212 RepID=A0AAD5BWW2_AMBAR|nr:hypothetical protein M8C21_006346 [Ambrosia artemisiifolia]
MSSSIITFALHHPTHFHPLSSTHLLTPLNNIINPISKTHLNNNVNPIFKTHLKPTTSIITHLNKPTSHHPLITSYTPITNFLSKKILTLLIGSFLFMGFCNKNVVLANPVQDTSQSQSLEGESLELDEDEEERMCVKLLESNPKDVVALKEAFHVKMKRGKTKEAIQYVERLVDVEPKEVEWRLLQALCYEMVGDYAKAKGLFKDVLKERPLLLRALHGLAMVMHKNHEGPAVFEMLNNALEIARQRKKVADERNIRILIAQMHVVKGELDDALKLFKDLIDENPRDFRPYLCQGIIYSLLDKKEEAEEQFLTYQSLVPDEFPQRGFLEDVVLAAKTEIRKKHKNKQLKPDFLYRK